MRGGFCTTPSRARPHTGNSPRLAARSTPTNANGGSERPPLFLVGLLAIALGTRTLLETLSVI